MSKYYLLSLSSDDISTFVNYDKKRFNYPLVATHLQVEDKILLVHGAKPLVLPFIYKVFHVNRNTNTMVLALEEVYNRSVPSDPTLETMLARTTKHYYYDREYIASIPLDDVENITNRMGGKRIEEQALLNYIKAYITARGYYFDDETLYNYHICLKTRPFIILAGLSGTGKSKLSQLYAEALGHKKHYLRLPVRPNWSDDRYLLGHLNVITGEYMTEPAVEFVQEANQDPDNLYFFCLDEMNLAHVEYYFSQFLSAMEEEQPAERQIRLYSKQAETLLAKQAKEVCVPACLSIPGNLFFTGTINVDETTQPISDKVIDRANTLEFFTVDLDKIPQPTTLPDPIALSTFTWRSYQVSSPDMTYRSHIIEISKILNKASLGLGYRVLREIELYLANSKNLLDPLVAFDLQVKQRILARVRGTAIIEDTLNELLAFLKSNKLRRSEERLGEMKKRLGRDGYTTFWR
jgi:energy-coupling factor transporter ATP-binding protein EcfA2